MLPIYQNFHNIARTNYTAVVQVLQLRAIDAISGTEPDYDRFNYLWILINHLVDWNSLYLTIAVNTVIDVYK